MAKSKDEIKIRRFWCTKNNYTEKDLIKIRALMESCKFGIIHYELAPTTGTPHIHVGFHFKSQRSWNTIRKLFSDCQSAKGDDNSWINYGLFKDGKPKPPPPREPEVWGKPSCQGDRIDLDELKDKIKEGTKVDDIVLDNPMAYHQYGRTLNKIEDIMLRKKFRSWQTECIWYYGPTGVGKSHTAFEGYNPDTHYEWKLERDWQDGYTGQEIVIINEFRGQIPFSRLLVLIDKYPTSVERRGREAAPFLARKIIITSSQHPKDVYKHLSQKEPLDQLLRRVTLVKMDQKWSEGNTKLPT